MCTSKANQCEQKEFCNTVYYNNNTDSKDNIIDDSVEDDVRDLIYYSDNNKIALTFKFYQSQDNRMSSLTVDWFHDGE